METHRKSSAVVRNRHKAIIEKYDELVAAEMKENPDRARYLPKQYFISKISQDPILGLSENYITKIINNRYRYERY